MSVLKNWISLVGRFPLQIVLASPVLACAPAAEVASDSGEVATSRPVQRPLQRPLQRPAEEAPEDATPDAPPFDQEHAAWTALLAKHVNGDRFDYRELKASEVDRKAHVAYLEALASVTPESLAKFEDDERLAFWINVYNAFAVDLIVANYPLKSIEDLSTEKERVWDRRFIPLGSHLGRKSAGLSLDDVENKIIRERFKDARIHAAVNCASESCPPLAERAFTGKDLDKQLDAQMRAFIGDTSRNRLNAKKQRLELSSIFDWFAADFERDAGNVAEYVARYAPADQAEWVANPKKVSFLEYSWKLNDVRVR